MDVFPAGRSREAAPEPLKPVSEAVEQVSEPTAASQPVGEAAVREDDRTDRADRTDGTDGADGTDRTDRFVGRLLGRLRGEGSAWLKAARWMLTAAFAVAPFAFLPLTSAPVELNKEFIFAVLVLGAFIAWLGEVLTSGEIRYRKSLVHWGIAAVTVVGVVSVFFSAAPAQSIANIGLSHETIIGIIALGLFAFLVTAVFRSAEDVRRAFQWLIGVGAVYGAFNLVQITGTFLLPWEFAKNLNFTGAGSQNHLAVVFGILGVLLIGMVARRDDGADRTDRTNKTDRTDETDGVGVSAIGKIGYGMAGLIFFLNIAAINLRWTWLGLAVAMAAVLAFRMGRRPIGPIRPISPIGPIGPMGERRAMPRGMALPMLVLALSVFLALFKIPLARPFVNLPLEVSPSYGVSFSVAHQGLAARGPAGWFIGMGPGTFGYSYASFRPASLNLTAFWGVRFDQARSSLVNVISGQGYLGAAAWFGLMALFGLAAVRALYLAGHGEYPELALGAFGAIVFAWAVWFMYPVNLAALVVLFGLLGAFAFFERPSVRVRMVPAADGETDGADGTNKSNKTNRTDGTDRTDGVETVRVADDTERRLDLYRSSHRTLGASFAIILVMIIGVAGGYLELQRYVSGVFYGFGIEKLSRERDPARAIADFVRAAQFWGSEPAYYRALSQAFLQQASGTVSGFRPDESDVQATRTQLQALIENAIRAAQQAVALNRLDTQNWLALGLVYENIIPLVPGAEGQAKVAYETVAKLDPNAPLSRLFLARTAVQTADRDANQIQQLRANRQAAAQVKQLEDERAQLLDSAKRYLEEAIQFKPDFGPAHFLLVQVFDRQGDLASAVQRAALLAQAAPNDTGLWFQLGFLLYKSNDRPNAQAAFERAVALDQNFSNARYFLGLLYDGAGDPNRALEQFRKIQALNPDNGEVKRIVENLEAGRAALEGIVPPAPAPEARTEAPVEEKGETRVKSPERP